MFKLLEVRNFSIVLPFLITLSGCIFPPRLRLTMGWLIPHTRPPTARRKISTIPKIILKQKESSIHCLQKFERIQNKFCIFPVTSSLQQKSSCSGVCLEKHRVSELYKKNWNRKFRTLLTRAHHLPNESYSYSSVSFRFNSELLSRRHLYLQSSFILSRSFTKTLHIFLFPAMHSTFPAHLIFYVIVQKIFDEE